MSRTIVMHIDDAPWIRGGPRGQDGYPDGGGQLIGDRERGPWIHVNWLPGGFEVPPHHHSHDEILYVIEGGLVFEGRRCGPGTVLFLEKETEYGFRVLDEGVRFLNIRPGLATITMHGRTQDPYGGARGSLPRAGGARGSLPRAGGARGSPPRTGAGPAGG